MRKVLLRWLSGRCGKMLKLTKVALLVGLACGWMITAQNAHARDVTIKQVTKGYYISGRTAGEFARSMSSKGPYSFQHRRRAWATAARDLSYQLIRTKSRNRCKVKNAKVTLKITYTMPKLKASKGISARERRKWRKMYNLLNKHEKKHGRFYQQLANRVHKALKRLPSARTCQQLERNASKVVNSLSVADLKRNDAFDNRDRKNYRRMARIYRGS